LSVGSGSVVGVILIEEKPLTASDDVLADAVFAHTMIGHMQAIELRAIAEFARAHEGDEFAYLEVATRFHISDRAARRRMAFAVTLTERLPQTLAP
jgi:hypothetical protein